MKVLHITQNYYPSFGGTQYMMKHVSEHLHSEYNDDVTVFTTNSLYGPNNSTYKEIKEKESLINGITIKRFPFVKVHKPLVKFASKTSMRLSGKGLPEMISTLSIGPFSASMKQAILETQADVICASSVHYRFADYGLYRRQTINQKPFVLYGALHLETTDVPKTFINRIKAADHYIANTDYEKEFLVKQGISDTRITVAGCATDIINEDSLVTSNENIKKELNLPSNKHTILCISRHEAFKGLPVLVDAFIALQKNTSDVCLVIAGATGTYTNTLKQQERENNNIFIFTDISNETKCRLLHIADVVVLPSTEESFGVVFLEAWSFKKPVIGARIGAIKSLISENKDGCLFEPNNVSDLAGCIKQMLNDDEKCRQMGENGFKKVQQYYTWNKITATFRSAYLKAIEYFNQQKN